jgi:long-chain acyl-CoA synthetase
MLNAIAEHGATLMDGVPTAYYYLLAHRDFNKYDLSSLTRCWVGGQTLPAAKSLEFTARTGCPVHEVWGMTELAGATSANPSVGPNKPGTIGIPYPGNQMRIVDIADANRELGPGERGELMFRGPLVMDGYYGNPEGTREAIEPDGWLHSGDIATVKGELAKAYIVAKPGIEISRDGIVAHCREHLAAYKIPRAVQFVDQVPMTSSGKMMRRLLKDLDDGTR